MINTIIDINHNDALDLDACRKAGIVAIIHKVSEGATWHDPLYLQRRSQAKAMGFLWGGYHFSSSLDVGLQVENFLTHARFRDDELIALDWEKSHSGPDMTLAQAVDFVTRVHSSTGRFPVLYGGDLMRTALGSTRNPTLAECPLWYARYAPAAIEIPPTWKTYTLWQYTEGKEFNDNFPGVNHGGECDRNRYQGTADDLRAAWPLTRRT